MWLTIFVLHELGLNVAGYPKKKKGSGAELSVASPASTFAKSKEQRESFQPTQRAGAGTGREK